MLNEQIERISEVEDDAKFWQGEIDRASKHEREWRTKTAPEALKRYKEGEGAGIFWANVETLKPAVFSQLPAPDVRRRFGIVQQQQQQMQQPQQGMMQGAMGGGAMPLPMPPDPAQVADQLGRQAASIVETSLSTLLDDDTYGSAFAVLEAIRDDMLIVGRGVPWVVYHAEIERVDLVAQPALDPMTMAPTVAYVTPDGQQAEPEGGLEEGSPYIERKANEHIHIEYIPWPDYRESPAKLAGDVWWKARRHTMDRDQLIDEFGEAAGKDKDKAPLTLSAKGGEVDENDYQPDRDEVDSAFKRAAVWEIWSLKTKERIWWAQGAKKLLRKDPDPLGLSTFFPAPDPLYAISTTDSRIPIPEIEIYCDKAEELEEIGRRLPRLIRTIKAVALVPGTRKEIISIRDHTDGDIIPLDRPELLSGSAPAIEWWPIEVLANTVVALSARAKELKQEIYEITGIGDIIRGATDARETAAAQQLKGAFGQFRMTPRAKPMERLIRDVMRIMAEIMAEHFDRETLERLSGKQIDEAVLQLLREEKLRNTRIDVETESTVRPDVDRQKQDAAEYVQAVTGLIQVSAPILQALPMFAPLLGSMLRASARPYKWGREFEEDLDKFVAGVAQMAANPQPPQPSPDAVLKAEIDKLKIQLDAQKAQLDAQTKLQIAGGQLQGGQAELGAEIMSDMEMQARDHQHELEMQAGEHVSGAMGQARDHVHAAEIERHRAASQRKANGS